MSLRNLSVHRKAKNKRWLETLLADSLAMEGTYARVIPLDMYRVVKLTTCPASNELFNELARLSRLGNAPGALPAVLEPLGICAVDSDGFEYQGWVIERLFHPDDLTGQQLARIYGAAPLSKAKPYYKSQAYHSINVTVINKLQARLREESRLLRDSATAIDHAHVALEMAAATTGELKNAFALLAQLINRTCHGLDLLTAGNILTNMWGQPVLGDPIAPGCDMFYPESGGEEVRTPGQCVCGWIPVKQEGTVIWLEPCCSTALSSEEATEVHNRLVSLGLRCFIAEFGTGAHFDFIRQPWLKTTPWASPNAAQVLKQFSRQELLY